MPATYRSPFSASTPIRELVRQAASQGWAAALTAIGAEAYRLGIRTPVTRAAYDFETATIGSPRWRKAFSYLWQRGRDPHSMRAEIARAGGDFLFRKGYLKFFLALAQSSPVHRYWARYGYLPYILRRRNVGPHGMILPPGYKRWELQQAHRELRQLPAAYEESKQLMRQPPILSMGEELKRWLEGAPLAELGNIWAAFAGQGRQVAFPGEEGVQKITAWLSSAPQSLRKAIQSALSSVTSVGTKQPKIK